MSLEGSDGQVQTVAVSEDKSQVVAVLLLFSGILVDIGQNCDFYPDAHQSQRYCGTSVDDVNIFLSFFTTHTRLHALV